MKKIWDDKNNWMLGTMTDLALARILNVELFTVGVHRRKHNIPSYTARRLNGLRAPDFYKQEVASMTDEQLLRPTHEYKPNQRCFVVDERKRRGLAYRRRKTPLQFRHGAMQLKHAMVKAAFELTPQPTLQEVSEVLHITRERVRQILALVTKRQGTSQ